jgi:hypothetical protein
MKKLLVTSFVAFGVALGLMFSLSPHASAQEGGSLIIGVSQCPDGYEGQDFATDCVEPAAGVEFFIATPNTDNFSSTTSGGDGLATFNLEQFDLDPTGPDPVSVGEPATQTGDFAVACTVNEGEELEFQTEDIPFEPGGPLLGITFEFETGDDIACEWFRITMPMPGDEDQPVDDAGDDVGGVDVDGLPNTGAGTVFSANGAPAYGLLPVAGLLLLAGGALYAGRRTSIR